MAFIVYVLLLSQETFCGPSEPGKPPWSSATHRNNKKNLKNNSAKTPISDRLCNYMYLDLCAYTVNKKLDNGWPESVEEQGLLVSMETPYYKQYIKDVL